MTTFRFRNYLTLLVCVSSACIFACSEDTSDVALDESSTDLGKRAQEAVVAAPSAYPVAVGHDQIFYSNGQRKASTLANVQQAQMDLTARLLAEAKPEVRSVFEEMNAAAEKSAALPSSGKAAPATKLDKSTLSSNADKLDFLIAASENENAATLEDMSAFLRTKAGVAPSSALKAGATVGVKLATANSGQAYWNECAAAGVPNPPNWGSSSWVRQGATCTTDSQCKGGAVCMGGKCSLGPENLSGVSEVFKYTSTSPNGICIALPRRTAKASTTYDVLGIICQGNDTSRACLWDSNSSTTISTTESVSIPSSNKIIGGAALNGNGQGTCTSCHAGENIFIIHPRTSLDVTGTTARNWVRPLVAASWPQSVGPGKEMDRVGSYASGGTGGQPCSACHNKSAGRRFPRLEDAPGYCSVALWSYDNIMTPANFPNAGNAAISPTSAAHRALVANSANCSARAKATKFASAKTKWHEWFAPNSETPLVGDFNADGKDDIVTFVMDSGADVWVALSGGSSFGTASVWHGSFGFPGEQVRVGDFNGDGKDDIVTAVMNSAGHVYVATSSGSAFINSMLWNGHILSGEVYHAGDFNGDRRDDLVIFTKGSTNDALVQLSNGSSFGGAQTWHTNIASGSKVPLVGDFNADGYDDVVVFAMDTGADVHVSLSSGSGFGSLTLWHNFFGLPGEKVGVADMNGDGKDDLVTFVPGGAAYVALSTGSSFADSTIWHSNFAPSGQVALVADVNADHRADALLFTKGTSGDVFVSVAQP